MLEFLFGAATVAGVAYVLRRRRYGRAGGGRGPGGRLRWLGNRLFRRLDTTPGQEKVFLDAFEQLETSVDGLRGELRQTRLDLAQSLRGEAFDQALVEQAFSRHEATLAELRKKAKDALSNIHQALAPDQRRALATMIEVGRRRSFGHG